MIAYTDSLSFADAVLSQGPGWAPLDRVREEPGDAALLQAFFAGRTVHGARIETTGLWRRLVLVETMDRSQLEVLAGMWDDEAPLPAGMLCLAGSGEGLRGQRDRSWVALPGNLHLSAYLAPGLSAARAGAGLTVLPALAVLDALDATPGLEGRANIKWVNDILVDGCKVAGVLTRTRTCGEEITDAALGIGLNVERAPEVERDPFVPRVACLGDFGPEGEGGLLAGAFRRVARALETRYRTLADRGPGLLLDDYRGRSLVLGRRVRIHADGPGGGPGAVLRRGRVSAIGPNLELLLEGSERPVTRGRLVLEG